MARLKDVIEPRTHESQATYRSWLRKIGRSTYRFSMSERSDGQWEVRVDRSIGGPGRHWERVHHWKSEKNA